MPSENQEDDSEAAGRPAGASDAIDRAKTARDRKFKLVAVALVAVVAVLLDLGAGSLVDLETQASFRTSHPSYHHGLRPNQQRPTVWGARNYQMSTNSLGFRDRHVRDVPLQSEDHRVVLIGDSMIEGLGVEFDESVAGRLQARWSDEGVEVLNAAAVSYSPRLYDLRIRYLVEEQGVRFDQLVVFIDISDIQDETFYASFQPARAAGLTKPRRGWWQRHSLVANVARRVASDSKRIDNRFRTDAEINVWMEGTEAYLKSERSPEQGRFEWTVNEAVYNAWGARGLALAKKHMSQLVELCREHKIELSVVVYPSPIQIYASDRDSRQVKFWQEFCEETDVRFINLFPAFLDRAHTGPAEVYRKFFITSDVHWNPAGHQLVADLVAEKLRVPSTPTDDAGAAQR
jgi:lysophospholipase L1-like esterase